MEGKFTILDIARELNITPSTVSRALNDHPRISDETKYLVKNVANKMHYQPNHIASALRKGRTQTIGVIVPMADRSFFSSVIRGIEDEADKAGYNVMICQSNDSYEAEKRDIIALLRAQVDAIVVSIARETTDYQHFIDLKKRGVPLILFDRVQDQLGVSTVTIDDYNGAFIATKHLIEQGCRHIATIAGPQHINIYRERLRGYRDALQAHQQQADESHIVIGTSKIESGRQWAEQILNSALMPDAIFCASDYSALGAMQVLKEKGLNIPNDVALVGFANEPFTSFIEPSLTSIDQKPREMGEIIARLCLEQLLHKKNTLIRKTILNAELVIRKSSMRKA